jgi:Reverse transcriptase (RNA-dependent DNA polymerase)
MILHCVSALALPYDDGRFLGAPTRRCRIRLQRPCKLNKALYGLKQSARNWQIHLGARFQQIGFNQLPNDPSIFYKKGIIIITHIDDMIIFGENSAIIAENHEKLVKEMELTNLGEVKYFLGIEISRNRQKQTITLNQKGYIQRLIDGFAKGLAVKPNPCALGVRLEPNPEKASESEIHQFQQQIGSLMYLMTSTRPDLAFLIGQLARYMANPHGSHFRALQRV